MLVDCPGYAPRELGLLVLERMLNDPSTKLFYQSSKGTLKKLQEASSSALDKHRGVVSETRGPCPAYEYHPNPSKTWLLVKEQSLEVAKDIFCWHGINITSVGHRHLGSVLGRMISLRGL